MLRRFVSCGTSPWSAASIPLCCVVHHHQMMQCSTLSAGNTYSGALIWKQPIRQEKVGFFTIYEAKTGETVFVSRSHYPTTLEGMAGSGLTLPASFSSSASNAEEMKKLIEQQTAIPDSALEVLNKQFNTTALVAADVVFDMKLHRGEYQAQNLRIPDKSQPLAPLEAGKRYMGKIVRVVGALGFINVPGHIAASFKLHNLLVPSGGAAVKHSPRALVPCSTASEVPVGATVTFAAVEHRASYDPRDPVNVDALGAADIKIVSASVSPKLGKVRNQLEKRMVIKNNNIVYDFSQCLTMLNQPSLTKRIPTATRDGDIPVNIVKSVETPLSEGSTYTGVLRMRSNQPARAMVEVMIRQEVENDGKEEAKAQTQKTIRVFAPNISIPRTLMRDGTIVTFDLKKDALNSSLQGTTKFIAHNIRNDNIPALSKPIVGKRYEGTVTRGSNPFGRYFFVDGPFEGVICERSNYEHLADQVGKTDKGKPQLTRSRVSFEIAEKEIEFDGESHTILEAVKVELLAAPSSDHTPSKSTKEHRSKTQSEGKSAARRRRRRKTVKDEDEEAPPLSTLAASMGEGSSDLGLDNPDTFQV